VIEAAGGVVWRRGSGGRLEVLLVHRPRYDDWSFPKGKLDPGEAAEDAAIREVEEEAALRCDLGVALGEVRYVDRHGRDKRVRYWAMRTAAGAAPFVANEEVDELRWLEPDEARRLISYGRDAEVLDALERAELP
jgi:8-oxo-dGTP pyrophosphatase MutT (NUDIX family)